MTRTQEIQIDLNEGIDRQTLTHLRERFLHVNRARLLRATEGLTPRQQTVLSLLPLFFHVNHPLLPGYVSGSTPAGVAGYEPDGPALTEAQRLTRSFSYKARTPTAQLPIHGLFLMGSLGTLAQTDQSDMDVWICHAPDLSELALEELRKKCQLLEAWAAGLGADAHFFLIDAPRFALGERDARLSTDDCGTTQHYLLLDEFYRTAIWLAGRTPMWWWVPANEEANYAEFTHTLLSKRFIRADETIDLGHLAHIPPGEFVGAGLWQLFKGIESPYKSVLKLLLIEVYASEHPKVQCLSLRFKQALASVFASTHGDLAITDYRLDRAGNATSGSNVHIVPEQRFRDGFKVAGDDILLDVIQEFILPSFEKALQDAGVKAPASLMSRLCGAESGSAQDMVLRQQLNLQVFTPLGLELLRQYELYNPEFPVVASTHTYLELLGKDAISQSVLDYVNSAVRRELGGQTDSLDPVGGDALRIDREALAELMRDDAALQGGR